MRDETLNDAEPRGADGVEDAETLDWFDDTADAADAFVEDPGTSDTEDGQGTRGAQDADEPGADAPDTDPDAALIALDDGAEVSLADLKKSYARGQDHARHVADLARERASTQAAWNAYTEQAESLQAMYGELQRVAEAVLPQEPDVRLLQQDPQAYETQLLAHRQSMATLEQLMASRDAVSGRTGAASEAQEARHRADEEARLLAAMPALGDPDRRDQFDAAVKQAARDFGFSEDEIASTVDHRILRLVHYARLGRIAERNRKTAARGGGRPQPGRRPLPAPTKKPVNRAAMDRLVRSGSIEDALKVDFD